MIRILRRYDQEFEIRRGAVRHSDDVLPFHSHGYAYNFLSRCLLDPMNAHVLRSLYAETHAIHNTSWLTDHELLNGLAWDLVAGTITIAIRPRRLYPPILQPTASASESLPARPPPPPPKPAPPRQPVAPAPKPAPEADVDAEAQAATLKAAAETGVPFCEKCERAKRQAQQKAAEQPAPASEADVDAGAQAATLKAAAKTGVPFCEKCERAKRQAQQRASAT